MKSPLLFLCLASILFCTPKAWSQYQFEPSSDHPYGLPNPNMPEQLLDFAPLIGECDCKSVSRIDQNTWADTVDMIWNWKYIMNGMGVQDETLKADGKHSGSIRQYVEDSARWYVHYYSSAGPTPTLSAWEGNKTEEGQIILYKDQKAPNGMEGNYKIIFKDISNKGFNWEGQWVNKSETYIYPTWKIFCTKTKHYDVDENIALFLPKIKAFSKAYVDEDYESIANAYTKDAVIFPRNSDLIKGRTAIKEYWVISDGSKILAHKITPLDINIIGDYAYDYGYYEGNGVSSDEKPFDFKGKYVIVWKKEGDDWKMHLDMWNR